jgi:NAD(P)-dependent dehydrogenase (short-subunit alcohol dehydrogenase family)
MNCANRLYGKSALVTGGSRGIGAAIVNRLASEGAHVALTYASSPDRAGEVAKAAQALGVKSLAIQADSADSSAVAAAVERTVAELGGIDILVNNAGVLAIGPIDDFTLADFDRTFAVNVRAVFVATQAAVKHMKEGGRIINIGSRNAERLWEWSRLRDEQVCAARTSERIGSRFRGAGNHDQQCATRADRHGNESRQRRVRRDAQGFYGAAALRHGRGNRRYGRLSGEFCSWLRHRCEPDDRRGFQRLAAFCTI